MSTMERNVRVPDTRVPAPHPDAGRGGAAAASAVSVNRADAGIAVLRTVLGVVFLAHGAQKLFVFGLPGVIGAFEGMGIPLAGIAGPAVALLEFFGGLALIAGLFTRSVSVGLAAVMVGAIAMVHLPAGFFLPNGVEFVLTLFAGAVTLALTGAGTYSLDSVLGRRRARS